MFGGMERNNELTNTLMILKPGEKHLKWRKLETSGASPSERMLHSMTFMEKMNVLVIYGGRNMNKECFLSDIHILNLDSLQWANVELFGCEMSLGRCGHAAAAFNKRLIVFGGVHR